MIQTLLLSALFGIPAAYVLHCLLLEEKEGHYGPFRSESKKVIFISSQHEQPVVLWDYLRRIFGVYTVVENQWYVEDSKVAVERWTCPFCLSFWLTIPWSIFAILNIFGMSIDALIWIIPVHFTICMASYALHRALWT